MGYSGLDGAPIKAMTQQLREAGARIEELPAARLTDPRRFQAIRRYLQRERFDVIQTHLTYANILGALAGRLHEYPGRGHPPLHQRRDQPAVPNPR